MKFIIPELKLDYGEVVCPNCNGKSRDYREDFCFKCNSKGKISWIDSIIDNSFEVKLNFMDFRIAQIYVDLIYENPEILKLREHEDIIIINEDIDKKLDEFTYYLFSVQLNNNYNNIFQINYPIASVIDNFFCLVDKREARNYHILIFFDHSLKSEILK